MQSTKANVESYPAPPQLATKTDLSPPEVKAITEAVNPLIADAFESPCGTIFLRI